jgi:hypothetical protein
MEIHRADPAYRSRSLLLLALIVLACSVFLLLLHAWLQRISAQLMSSDPETLRHWLRGLLVGLAVLLAIPAALMGRALRRLGARSRLEQRFPPADWKTLRDVRVLRGEDASRWAGRTSALGSIAFAVAAGLALWAAWVYWHFH